MMLREAVQSETNYVVVNENGIVAINGDFGNKNYSEFMTKEVTKTKVIEGLYKNYTQIRI